MKIVQVIGSIPFQDTREKNRLIDQLKADVGRKVRIKIENSLIIYQYSEFAY